MQHPLPSPCPAPQARSPLVQRTLAQLREALQQPGASMPRIRELAAELRRLTNGGR